MGETPPAVAERKGRSNEELAMRALIVPRLRDAFPDARVIHELPLRYSTNRIDLAAVTEDEIISVEIKSSRDVADRLERQVRAFMPVSSRVIVALAPKWNESLPTVERIESYGKSYTRQLTEVQAIINGIRSATEGRLETWTVCAATANIEVTDGAHGRSLPPWPIKMLDMLWREELLSIAAKHRVSVGKKPAHLDIRNACEEFMTGREIRRAVCSALRSRSAFDKASDAPTDIARTALGDGQ